MFSLVLSITGFNMELHPNMIDLEVALEYEMTGFKYSPTYVDNMVLTFTVAVIKPTLWAEEVMQGTQMQGFSLAEVFEICIVVREDKLSALQKKQLENNYEGFVGATEAFVPLYAVSLYETRMEQECLTNESMADSLALLSTIAAQDLVTMLWQDFKAKHLSGEIDISTFPRQFMPLRMEDQWLLIQVHYLFPHLRNHTSPPDKIYICYCTEQEMDHTSAKRCAQIVHDMMDKLVRLKEKNDDTPVRRLCLIFNWALKYYNNFATVVEKNVVQVGSVNM
ncbi:hypothetical protein FIBSPDRAFT_885811 [Athelia psychrophila]|uniref:Uncharacterized protein n=1 Tax=Athelia psychrophila TaxID=1759441 RepID=A0A166RFG4_9AGAM|nr:hypothetical protein FIBSPDRAFT_885811 [Fibularhizoctonia sp. CBS 109695]